MPHPTLARIEGAHFDGDFSHIETPGSIRTDFTAAPELHRRLEVTIEPVGSDPTDETADIGSGLGMTSLTIHRCNGHLWLSKVGDWAGRRCKGWTMMVSSVEEATARIACMLATSWR